MDEKIKEIMGLVDYFKGAVEFGCPEDIKIAHEDIESKLRELVPGWLPIESAPKDGSWIQLWRAPETEIGVHNPLVIARWSSEDEEWIWPTGAYDPFTERGIERANEDIEAGDCFYSLEFTHWMPLPNGPVAAAQQEIK